MIENKIIWFVVLNIYCLIIWDFLDWLTYLVIPVIIVCKTIENYLICALEGDLRQKVKIPLGLSYALHDYHQNNDNENDNDSCKE